MDESLPFLHKLPPIPTFPASPPPNFKCRSFSRRRIPLSWPDPTNAKQIFLVHSLLSDFTLFKHFTALCHPAQGGIVRTAAVFLLFCFPLLSLWQGTVAQSATPRNTDLTKCTQRRWYAKDCKVNCSNASECVGVMWLRHRLGTPTPMSNFGQQADSLQKRELIATAVIQLFVPL